MEIIPFRSVGALFFGDMRDDARAKIGDNFSAFIKDVGENETDSFDNIGLHLFYDCDERLEFVEAFEPAIITFNGVQFIGQDMRAVTRDMNAFGYTGVNTDIGIMFPEVGIALTAPSGIVEGVAAYRKGYYD